MDKKLMMLNMLKRLSSPNEVVSGSDSVRRLQTLPEGKAFVVLTPSVKDNGKQDNILSLLARAGIDSTVHTVASGEPTVKVTTQIAEQMITAKADWIIAVGGGSVLDAAKIAWACYEYPQLDFSQPPPITTPPLRQKARLIAIPTTAGSGSEGSQAAVLKSIDTNTIHPYISTEWIPDISILDPKLTVGMKPAIIAQTGMDALTHAIEAYVSRLSCRLIKTVAASAIRLIINNLPLAYRTPDDLDVRENMLNGAYFAGLSQSAASTGFAHALTHASSVLAGISHGSGSALFMLPTIRLNREKNPAVYDSLAQDAGYSATQFLEELEQLTESLDLPRTLSDITELHVDQTLLSAIAEKAQTDVCMRTNPYRPTGKEVISLLEKLT